MPDGVEIKINAEVRGMLDKHRIRTGPRGEGRWTVGDSLYVLPQAVLEPFIHLVEPQSLPLRFGAFSYSYGRLNEFCMVGRYCSIAVNVGVMGAAHPTDWASTSPIFYGIDGAMSVDSYFKAIRVMRDAGPEYIQPATPGARIGNDVWIGQDVMLARGVSIGDGAIVAAGSIVTKDVPPYAVVAGVPARTLRLRFAEPVVEAMIASAWWRYGPEILQKLDVSNPEAFLSGFREAVEQTDAMPRRFKTLRGEDLIAAAEGDDGDHDQVSPSGE